ncbi:N-formylglutamate amidohydrolase [Micrococcus sp. HG099]|uniref:N-formylglutamate amidohydrolase n=1 Tax=Micrococcus sp. HG099 TaxID=2969755 RepID=UPI00215AD7DB|nr:N-formylglutamate amidohydrolase [Micrococcus sp. HG099]MCR8676117.1 N-formylglutamate amidohydrolase [Micrococcus sp. HG099]
MTDLAAEHPRTDAVESVSTRTHGEPFAVVGPWKDDPAAAGQVVFTTVHSGHDLRPEVAERMILPEDDRFREEDPFTDAIAGGVGSGMVMHRSRFEVDLNRPRATAVYMEPGQCWGLDVWRGGRLDEDVAERSRQVHDAWYAELGRRLDVLAARGPYAVFDVHSFNHRRDGADAGPAPQEQNPDVNVGTGSLDREPWIPVVDAFMDSMARPLVSGIGRRLDVRENVRFWGQNEARWAHRRHPDAACVLALEFKKEFMDEWTGRPDPAVVAELSAALADAADAVAQALADVKVPTP